MRTTLTALCAIGLATVLAAHEGVKDPDVMIRMHVMKDAKASMAVLGDMAKGQRAFDPAVAEQARRDLMRYALDMPNVFETPAQDPKSEALPVIWTSFPDFTQRALTMNVEFEALDVSSLETLRAGLPAAAVTCRACHQTFRKR